MSQTIPMHQQKNFITVNEKKQETVLYLVKKEKTTMFLEKSEHSLIPFVATEIVFKRLRLKFSLGFCGKK